MNRADVTGLPETAEMMRANRRDFLPVFPRPSLNMDLSRPPEPGSFRSSLEMMRRSTMEISRPSSPRARTHVPARNRRDARDAPQGPGERTAVRKTPEQRPGSSEQTVKNRRPAEPRKHEPAPGADREQASVRHEHASLRPEQTPEPDAKNPGAVEPQQQGDAVVRVDSGNLQVTAAAAGSAEETAVKTAAGDGKQTSSGGTAAGMPGDGAAARGVSQGVGGSEQAAPPEPGTEQGGAQSDAGEGAAGTKKSQVALSGKAAGGKSTKTVARPSIIPPAAESGEGVGSAGTRAKATVVASVKAAVPGDAAVQAPPPAVSRETAASSASAEAKMAATLEGASAGRVARVGTDNQSGQTGAFQGHHGATGGIQGGGSTGAADAPGQPFAHDLLQQVTEKAVFHLRNGKVEARIELKPESLGHLKLHVSTDNGQVTLKIITASTWVRDIIESNINHLRNELQQHNLQIDRLDVSVSGGGQDSAGGNPQMAASSRATTDSAGAGEGGGAAPADEEAPRHPSVQRTGVGLVDYFA